MPLLGPESCRATLAYGLILKTVPEAPVPPELVVP
jgi:hypothetical protein